MTEEVGKKRINKAKLFKYTIYTLWGITILGVLFMILFFISLAKTDLPSFEDLENPEYDFASIIYDDNKVPFGKYYIENREPIAYEELSPYILNALISTEDERYFSHSGIDVQALMRVAFKTVLLRKESSGGGSTISQQLAKLLFDRPSTRGMGKIKRSIELAKTKFKEWITAVKLEKSYTKEEIIAMYLNKFEFINGAHGIQAASQTYFNANQDQLDVEEAAVLVGMLKNPSYYSPVRFPERSKNRRDVVLNQMKKYDHITHEAYDTLVLEAIDMTEFNRKTQSEGPAPYFRAELTKWLRNVFVENDIKKSDGTPYNIYTDGLKIYTTINLRYQEIAEKAVKDHMAARQESYFRVWRRLDPWTYDADDFQKKIRKDVLERKIKASDRYLSLRSRNMDVVINKVREKYGNELPLSDVSIKALLEIENKKSSFSEMEDLRDLKNEYRNSYQKLLKEEGLWNEFKKNWEAHVVAYEEAFNKAIPMMIFDYNEQGEKLDTMSPIDSVRYHNKHLQAGMLAVDPHTGYIKAWVGGIDHKYFKYDHVNSRRQVGSTIKPFVYATAISVGGINPCQEFDDIQYTIIPGDSNFDVDKEWSPANANGEFTGNKYNLFHGLLYSKNSITVRIVKEMGNVEVIRTMLSNCGIDVDYELPGEHVVVPNVPSISLGAVDLSLMEMTGAYTTFANNGMYTEPVFIKTITDKNGKIIYNGIPKQNLAINPVYNSVMVEMLQNNVSGRYGMGTKTPVGGKTGTTNDYADGWFMGISPNLVVGTWVGGDDQWIRFLTLNDGQGFVMARPIFQKFMQGIESDSLSNYNPKVSFRKVPSGAEGFLDCERYKQENPEDERENLDKEKLKKDEIEEEFEEDFEEDFR